MYYLMISHSWSYQTHYNKIVEWLDDGLGENNWHNYSISADKPYTGLTDSELKEKISYRIQFCGAIIVLASMYATYSSWIDYEIDEAVRQNKVIIGVKPWGQERIPKKIQDNATVMVGWNKKSVVNAVKDYYGKNKTSADSEARAMEFYHHYSFISRYN